MEPFVELLFRAGTNFTKPLTKTLANICTRVSLAGSVELHYILHHNEMIMIVYVHVGTATNDLLFRGQVCTHTLPSFLDISPSSQS